VLPLIPPNNDDAGSKLNALEKSITISFTNIFFSISFLTISNLLVGSKLSLAVGFILNTSFKVLLFNSTIAFSLYVLFCTSNVKTLGTAVAFLSVNLTSKV
jgi:hypothetical protein